MPIKSDGEISIRKARELCRELTGHPAPRCGYEVLLYSYTSICEEHRLARWSGPSIYATHYPAGHYSYPISVDVYLRNTAGRLSVVTFSHVI